MSYYKQHTVTLFTASLGLLLAACGGEASYTIADGVLSGTVEGQQFNLAAAGSDDFLSDADDFFVSFYSEDIDPCTSGSDQYPQLLGSIPTATGEYPMSLGQNVTLIPSAGANIIATEGLIRVDEITDDIIRGGMALEAGESEISGTFEITRCP